MTDRFAVPDAGINGAPPDILVDGYIASVDLNNERIDQIARRRQHFGSRLFGTGIQSPEGKRSFEPNKR